ncbi:propanediol utilization protein [Lachnoclostridium sp. An196]|uniref:PduL/EutD family phosphate acyltransferase n=1 Tax=Lachnoclostridium sp. An196 TaxID=1965583 RepID=UPI000B383BBD|nr:phosphate propanoyltransferase [Lachnoclostridium sp. An196]OUP22501.1 propanediol utilization protein [Lachnoclostridium sp. An196]HIS08154.1 phosphate propanoyltransferase [Candidatus Choladocola avistercoris]
MEQLIEQVMDTMTKAGLVQVEVSARHVHLTDQDVEVLFGKGAVLHEKRPLSQKGQYLSEERVTLIGPKGKKERVAVLGPVRSATQVELSVSDCVSLGVKAPLRESGDVEGSGPITIEGPAGSISITQGTIVAHNHIHVPTDVARMLDLKDKEHVSVKILSERPVTFEDVIIRVSDAFTFRMHIDFDEANAASVSGFTLGKIIPHGKE